MRITLDKLVSMKPQAICKNGKLLKEFAKVRKELLKKGFNKLTFEDTKDRSSRLWFEDRKLVAYDTIRDEATVRFSNSDEVTVNSKILNINRLIVIKSIAEYLLQVA